ncbi:MAG: MarR family transcriptional regulator [Novosphingobium sp.]
MTNRLIAGKELAGLIGYQVQMANLFLNEQARTALDKFQISPAKLSALLLIRDNAGCEQSALGRALSINRSSAMKLVNVLADRNLVERRPGRNLRSNALHLTEQGRIEIAAMAQTLRNADDASAAALSINERAEFLRLLEKLQHGKYPMGTLSEG